MMWVCLSCGTVDWAQRQCIACRAAPAFHVKAALCEDYQLRIMPFWKMPA